MGSRFLRPSVVVLAGALIAAAPGAGADKGEVVSNAPLQRSGGMVNQAFVPGELIVQFRAGASTAARSSALRMRGAMVAEGLGAKGLSLVKLPEGASVTAEAQALEDNPSVEFAEPNYVRHLTATVPNDPRFADLWGLNQAADHDIDAPEAWDLNTGSPGVIVAVIDSGVAYTHPDLARNIWINDDPAGGGDNDGNGRVDDTRGWDFVQEDNTPLDFNGHGTHVAGTIGAQGNNALGVTGVNWDVAIMPLRAADAYGGLTDADIAQAMSYACQNGADIINGSFSGALPNLAISNAITSGACANTLFVFAAGNDGINLEAQRQRPQLVPVRVSPLGRGRRSQRDQCPLRGRHPGGRHAGELFEPQRQRRSPRRAGHRHLEHPAGVLDAPGLARRLRGHDSRLQQPLERPANHARATSSGIAGLASGSPGRTASPIRRRATTTTTPRPRSAACRSSAWLADEGAFWTTKCAWTRSDSSICSGSTPG